MGAPIANFRSSYFALYLQDAWKVTPRLSLNWGLRWEYDQPYYDKHDALVNVDFRWDNSIEPTFVRGGTGDPYEGNPGFPWAPDVKYVRDGRFGRTAYAPDYNDFAPRLGIAFQINSKTVLRTGAGIYYVRDIGNAVFDIVRNAPFTIRRNEPADPVRPNQSWERPLHAARQSDVPAHQSIRRAHQLCAPMVVRDPARAGRRYIARGELFRKRPE